MTPIKIRSFVSAGFQPSLNEMKKLPDAGCTSGSDLKAASQVLGTMDTARRATARQHATGAQLAVFSAAPGRSLRPHDPKGTGRLLRLGINDPAKLRPWTAGSHNRATSGSTGTSASSPSTPASSMPASPPGASVP